MSRVTAPTRPSPGLLRWVPRVLVANLVAQVLIVVTGGAVRLTGSGLGCSTWPQCEPGEFAPVLHEATSWHPVVEFGNRTLTGVLGVLALAAAVLVWRTRRARDLRVLALVPVLGVLVQAVIGGLTVLVDLHPGWVGAHFLVSAALIAASTVLVVRVRQPDLPSRPVVSSAARRASLVLIPLGVAVLALGVVVTGAGPHSGDAEVGYRFALDPVAVAKAHAASVWLYLAVLAVLVLLLRRDRVAGPATAWAYRSAHVLLGTALVQGLIGYVQYLTELPVLLVGAHMLGAALLVVAQSVQLSALRERHT